MYFNIKVFICLFILQPRLADTRRQAIHCADLDLEYYRLRSFSITSHGVCNLGDSLRYDEELLKFFFCFLCFKKFTTTNILLSQLIC